MDSADAALVLFRQLSHRLALSVEVRDLALLALIEPLWPAELLAKPTGALDPLVTAGADQVTLELGNAAGDDRNVKDDLSNPPAAHTVFPRV